MLSNGDIHYTYLALQEGYNVDVFNNEYYDPQGNLVCYENDELEVEFTSSKWGIISVFKNPSVKDDTSTPITIGPAPITNIFLSSFLFGIFFFF